jgi:hypothetical protein
MNYTLHQLHIFIETSKLLVITKAPETKHLIQLAVLYSAKKNLN